MSYLQVFDFNAHSVRTLLLDGDPWFVARDVCDVLGLSNVSMALQAVDQDDINQIDVTDAVGRNQKSLILSEAGLYTLMLRSDKAQAKPFKVWVTRNVLLALHKTGTYSVKPMSTVEMLAVQCQVIVEHEQRLAVLETQAAQ